MSWDDGKHQKVKKVQLTYDDIIYSIQVSYEGTLQSQLRGSIGPKSAEFTLELDEYITALSAYGKTLVSQEVITALTFTTNKRTYGPYGNKTGYQISAPEGTGKQIAGFLGTSSNILNSIDVHYAPVPSAGTGGSGTVVQKLDAKGGTGGTVWDDGSDHDGVTRITLDTDDNGIEYVQFDYVKGGQAKLGVFHGGGKAFPRWMVIKHPEEYLISVECCYSSSSNMIQGIQFKTNKNTSESYGDNISSDDPVFTLKVQGKKIIGFHGSASNHLNSIGAYFVPTTTSTTPTGGAETGGSGTGGTGTEGTGTGATGTGGTGTGGSETGGSDAQRLEAQGGIGGVAWDDGSDHDGLMKVTVGSGGSGIEYVQFNYVKGGQAKLGVNHGGSKAIPNYVMIKHPEEYLVSVEGWYDSSNVILGIQFKTNKNTSQYFGYDFSDDGTKFTLQVQDKKIIGFHGSASNNLNSIGAYFVPTTTSTTPTNPPKKLKAEGGETGAVWDDGAHDNVTKVYVGQGDDGIAAVKFVYANGSQVVVGNEHGKKTFLGFEGFELASDEYIKSVEGTYDKIFGNDGATLTRLIFKTNKNRTEGPYGLEGSTPFTLKEEGYKIVGFHGLAGHASINAIGAYLAPVGTIPLTPPKPAGQKLEGIGGEGGTSWDDGVFDGVRKVSVGQGEDGIGAVKFVYDKGAQAVTGDVHGKRTLLGFEDFVLDYPSEYITAVEGTYDQISASNSEIITMLRFKTNKQTSIPFGLEAGKPFSFKKEGHKIIGFHGKAGDLLHKFGVHVVPIN